MNHPEFGFAIEYVDDIEAATRFYGEVMGLEPQRQHPAFVQYEHFAIASDEAVGGIRERELYWLVEDAEAAFREVENATEVTLPVTEMPFGKVFGLRGPAGQPCFLLELAKDRPSEVV